MSGVHKIAYPESRPSGRMQAGPPPAMKPNDDGFAATAPITALKSTGMKFTLAEASPNHKELLYEARKDCSVAVPNDAG